MDLDYREIYNSLSALVAPGSVFELRLLGTRRGQVDSGYFNDPAQAATALVSLRNYYKGIYFTPNPVMPDALARSFNRITPWAQTQTHDPEITRRRWLLIDIDAKRPTGISSNDIEHKYALNKARSVADMLALCGFCAPSINDSGNGAHLMYLMDEENSETVRDEIQTFLHVLKAMFDDAQAEIDQSVFNAARIWRVPGTWARKGDSTTDRPHRRAKIVKNADPFSCVSLSQLLRFNTENIRLIPERKAHSTRKNANDYPADEALYKRLNEYALRNLKAWVPKFFPDAREYKEGYRVTSADLGLNYEEDLTIHPMPMGIKYFGLADQGEQAEGRRTPVGVVAEFSLKTDKAGAAQKLSDVLNFPITEMGAIPPQVLAHGGVPANNSIEPLLGVRPKINFKGIRSIADLQRQEFKPIKWVVTDVIPIGNMLLAARPKMRKTWLALQLSMAVVSGRKFLDWECVKSDVLFLGLEDNERRIQNRIRTLQKFDIAPPDLSGFRYWTGGMDYNARGQLVVSDPAQAEATLKAFPRGEAGVDALEQYLEEYPETRVIAVDTLAHFRGERTSRDVYQSDYESMMPITKLAARKEVLIILVHHEKKGNADRGIGGDFLEDASGSAGITGGADGMISIKGRRGVQDENESRKLLITGRDVKFDYEVDISFDAERGGWLKAAKEDTKVAIRELLTRHPFLNQRDLQNLLPNSGQARIYRCLTDMKLTGEIEQNRFGYSLRRV